MTIAGDFNHASPAVKGNVRRWLLEAEKDCKVVLRLQVTKKSLERLIVQGPGFETAVRTSELHFYVIIFTGGTIFYLSLSIHLSSPTSSVRVTMAQVLVSRDLYTILFKNHSIR